jgi:mono/diheme cytochrome c family protein
VSGRARITLVCLAVALSLFGCSSRKPEPQFTPSKKVTELETKLQSQIAAILAEQCGSPLEPRSLGDTKMDPAHLELGAKVFQRYCQQCHGTSGDGNGPFSTYMNPRPRDYRPGVFKFTSTTYGAKPLREDLLRTVRRGIVGTSMPSFRLLPQQELEAVIDYVLALTHRGELEIQLADTAELEGAIDPKNVPEVVSIVLGKWNAARSQVVYPATPMPEWTAEHVEAGKKAFLSKGCSQCHGEDGRGQTQGNIGVDFWGRPTQAADLTSGMLRGGTEPIDLYRHVDAGINGTPMPSFHTSLQQELPTIWQLVAYVLHLSNERRRGVTPDAGLLKPLPGVQAAGEASAQRLPLGLIRE